MYVVFTAFSVVTVQRLLCIAVAILGSRILGLAASQSRDYGITKLVKIILFRMLNDKK